MQFSRFFSVDGKDQFGVFFLPDANHWPEHWVLVCPAFAEEQNKTRALVARQSRLWSQQGYGVLQVDLHGTGDSPYALHEGASCEPRAPIDWESWIQQLLNTAAWLGDNGAKSLRLFGLRLGALIALDLVGRFQSEEQRDDIVRSRLPPLKQCLLWQPVLSGKTYITQLLRLRTAGSAISGDAQESVADLRALAEKHGVIEVAGYSLPNSLIASLDQIKADSMPLASSVPIHWIDINRNADKPLPPVTTKFIEQRRSQQVEIALTRVQVDAFWSSQELVSAPELLALSKSAFPPQSISAYSREIPVEKNHGDNHSRCFTDHILIQQQALDAIIHRPLSSNGCGVVLVVGGPQYRVGSHRQFFELAEYLCQQGFLVMRFDCQGMGDSEGEFPGFENLDENIAAAVNHLYQQDESLTRIALWGLCDAATAISFYAASDERVKQIVLLNPWVRSEAGLAQARLKHYYAKRLLEGEFWKKLLSGRFNAGRAIAGVGANLSRAISSQGSQDTRTDVCIESPALKSRRGDLNAPLVEQMQSALSDYQGKALLVLSGRDLTAQEFEQQAKGNSGMSQWLARESVDLQRFADADHTFSRAEWKRQLERLCSQWLSQGT